MIKLSDRKKYLLGLALGTFVFAVMLVFTEFFYISIILFVISVVSLIFGIDGLRHQLIIKKCLKKGVLSSGRPVGNRPVEAKYGLYGNLDVSYFLEDGKEMVVRIVATYYQIKKAWEVGKLPVRVYKKYAYPDFKELAKIINQQSQEKV